MYIVTLSQAPCCFPPPYIPSLSPWPPVASPSCFGQVDEPLWGAPFPWCQPLPGATPVAPLVDT